MPPLPSPRRSAARAWLLDDSEDIEAAIRGEGDEEIDGLDREEPEEDDP